MSKKGTHSARLGEVVARVTGGRTLARVNVPSLPSALKEAQSDFETDKAEVQAEMRRAFSDPSFRPKPLPDRSPEASARIMASRAEMIARDIELPSLRAHRSVGTPAPEVVRARAYDGFMAPTNKRTVTPHPDGWSVDKPGATRASSVHPTQKQAIDAARQVLQNSGGGELAVKDRDGAVRAQDTVAPGNDPRRTKG